MILIEEYMLLSKEKRQKHLRLDEPCLERGGDSQKHKGVLVVFLDTTFPVGRQGQLLHACGNGKCSNPRHLYWGTQKENIHDAIEHGSHTSPWYRAIAKHGLEKANKLCGKGRFKKGQTSPVKGRKLAPQPAEVREKHRAISKALWQDPKFRKKISDTKKRNRHV